MAESKAGASVKHGETMLEPDSEFVGAEATEVPSLGVSLESTRTSLWPVEGVNVKAETREGGFGSGETTDTGGSAGWIKSDGGCTGPSGAETKAGTSTEAEAAMLVEGPRGEFIEGVADRAEAEGVSKGVVACGTL